MWRRILKKLHPVGIPWPGSVFYNAISRSRIFQLHYELVAQDILQKNRVENVLDIGTGPAWLLLALQKFLPNGAFSGVDISPAMVAEAKRNLQKVNQHIEIEIKVGSAESLPYPDKSFDCIVSTGSLHHWKNAVAGLNEVYRVLKNGHTAYIYDLVRTLPNDQSRQIREKFGLFRWSLLWLHSFEEPFLDADEMLSVAKKSHFNSASIRYVGALCCLELKRN